MQPIQAKKSKKRTYKIKNKAHSIKINLRVVIKGPRKYKQPSYIKTL